MPPEGDTRESHGFGVGWSRICTFAALYGVCCVVRAAPLEGHHSDHPNSGSEALAASMLLVATFRVARLTSQTRKLWCRDRPSRS